MSHGKCGSMVELDWGDCGSEAVRLAKSVGPPRDIPAALTSEGVPLTQRRHVETQRAALPAAVRQQPL